MHILNDQWRSTSHRHSESVCNLWGTAEHFILKRFGDKTSYLWCSKAPNNEYHTQFQCTNICTWIRCTQIVSSLWLDRRVWYWTTVTWWMLVLSMRNLSVHSCFIFNCNGYRVAQLIRIIMWCFSRFKKHKILGLSPSTFLHFDSLDWGTTRNGTEIEISQNHILFSSITFCIFNSIRMSPDCAVFALSECVWIAAVCPFIPGGNTLILSTSLTIQPRTPSTWLHHIASYSDSPCRIPWHLFYSWCSSLCSLLSRIHSMP